MEARLRLVGCQIREGQRVSSGSGPTRGKGMVQAVESKTTKRKGWLKPHPGLRGKGHTQDDKSPLSCQVSPWPTDTELWFLPGQVQVGVDTVFSRDPEKVSLHRERGTGSILCTCASLRTQCPSMPSMTLSLP